MPHRPQRRTTGPTRAPLSEEIDLWCLDEAGRALSFRARFGYSAEDPYAVRVAFPVPGGAVHWVLARTLLQRGLHEPTGEGDVLLRPGLSDSGRPVVVLELRSPEGRLVVEARASDLLAFLVQTWSVVQPGSESDHVDLDRLVEELLSD